MPSESGDVWQSELFQRTFAHLRQQALDSQQQQFQGRSIPEMLNQAQQQINALQQQQDSLRQYRVSIPINPFTSTGIEGFGGLNIRPSVHAGPGRIYWTGTPTEEWTWGEPNDAADAMRYSFQNWRPAEIDAKQYWRQNMPANAEAAIPLMALLPRRVATFVEACDIESRMVCLNGWTVSYALAHGPFNGTVIQIDLQSMPELSEVSVWVQGQISLALNAEWQNYRNEWRMTPQGAVRLSDADRAFAQEQARFEQMSEDDRQGVLGP